MAFSPSQINLSNLHKDKVGLVLDHLIKEKSKDEDLCFVLTFLLRQFTCRTELKLKINLFKLLVTYSKNDKDFSKHLLCQLIKQIFKFKDVNPTLSISKDVLFYSKLSTNFVLSDIDEASKVSLIEAHSILGLFFAKSKSQKLFEKYYKHLKSFLRKLSEKDYENYIAIHKNICSTSASLNSIVLWNNILRFDVECAKKNCFSLHKSHILEIFIKNVVMSKEKLSEIFPPNSFNYILNQLEFVDFQTILLPSLQKSILRSAEISLSLIPTIFQSLSFDLSQISQEIGKILGNYLHSKEEFLQDESIAATKVFVDKCSSLDSINFLLNHFIKIYNGSEGKLTVLSQKYSVLKGIGILSFNKIVEKQSRQIVLNTALEELTKIIKQEVTESNILMALSQIKIYIDNSHDLDIPDQFWKFVKDFKKSKLSSSLSMAIIFECINLIFHINNNTKHLQNIDEDFFAIILNSSKNLTSSITKIQVLTESLHSSTLLLKLYSYDKKLDVKLKNYLTSLSNLDKVTFLTEKFAAESTSENLLCLINFISLVFQNNLHTDDNNQKILFKVLISLMCHPTVFMVRTEAINFYKNFLRNNPQFVYQITVNFYEMFKEEELSANTNAAKQNLIMIKCCQELISFGEIQDESILNKIISNVLNICHLPCIYTFNSSLFLNFLQRRYDSSSLPAYIEKNYLNIVNLITDSNLEAPLKLNIVKTFTKLSPHKFVNCLVRQINANLEQHVSQLKSISKSEYETYLTPSGVLYDKSEVIAAGENLVDKNMKRESKLYSYKEQIAEMELRKELEAKNNGKDSLDITKLTKKQEEIFKKQLLKEEEIRNRLFLLDKRFTFDLEILSNIIQTDSTVASIYFKDFIFTLVNLFTSILCFKKASDFFTKISHQIMFSGSADKSLEYLKFVDTVAHTSVEVYKSNQNPDEDLCNIIKRLIDFVFKKTCPNGYDYDEKLTRLVKQNRFTTPAFSYMFPLFRFVLLNLSSNELSNYDEVVEQCFQIINQHTLMRNLDTPDILKNPQNLPIKLMLETIIKYLEKNDLNNAKLAASTLIQIISCVNGDDGCGEATTGDIFALLNSLTNQNDLIRLSCFEALEILSNNILPKLEDNHCREKLLRRIFIGMFDSQSECQIFANKIFTRCNFKTYPKMLYIILDEDVVNINSILVVPVAQAYKSLIDTFPSELENVYEKLVKFYFKEALSSIPLVDSFGRPLSKDHIDLYESRLTIAYIFKNIVPLFNQTQVENFIKFLIPEALSDNNEFVRSIMLEAGCHLIDCHGKSNINYFLDVFETFLDTAPDDYKNDLVRKSVIIFMGTLAKHIENDNPKLKPILSKLVEALSTPSQIVQEAVANCLQHLIPKFKDDAPALLQKLLEFLFESEIYGERKGAAYGIAGIVKGLGILSLNKLGIMDALTQAIQTKDKPNNREGALFAFEMLSSMLGRLFEPYIVHILPYLLDCFGDSSTRVRQAADDTSKIIMSKLSAPGVTLIYPAILLALEDDSWRKRTSSIDLLGSMAYCAPKQLSQCLPKIVPKLMTVITDSHPKVQRSAAQALKQIGSVIKNPEIQEIVPTLLEALQDPANKTNQCLYIMLNMKFIHVIDPPSLALIMPVIQRAFQNRSTETRKMASQIIGNMYALTKSKDLSPYLPSIIPGLKNSLLDPVPEVRSVTSRALGAMVKGLGDEILADLLPWLKEMLISEASSVDRSGAAQGLSEVLGGLGVKSLETFMPEIISITERTDVAPYIKDGYIMLYIYLPLVFTQHFVVYINQVINPILQALADENEFVRETALRAGQRIVNMYAETAIQLLLPELERGLFDENWRIRYSSVQLLGDLLFKIIGVSGKMTTESFNEDDNFGTEQSHRAIFDAMGEERRNRVLSGLYMGRSDVSLQVRQASLHVWKVIVPNTPRTLKEILPVLFSLLLGCLASNSSDRQQIAARTLGDLVRKLGERILPEIIPILEQGLQSDRPDQRQGVCIGLSEIIASTSREMIQAFADSLIPTVKKALFDSLPEVRQAAAKTFDQLYSAIGNKAIDDILSNLLDNLDDPNTGERTLDSLKNIISFKSKVVLPYLIPKLIAEPVNTKALAFISSVAGDSLSKHLPKIMPALLSALSTSFNTDLYQQQLQYCQTVIVSIMDEHGARSVVLSLLDSTNTGELDMRRVATSLLVTYCVQSKPSIISNFRSQLLRGLIHMLSSTDEFILNQCVEALNAITKNLDSKEQLEIVPEVSSALRHTLSDFRNTSTQNEQNNEETPLPGFCTNKGILPILTLFKEALLSSNIDIKEEGANGYKDVIKSSSADALKPSIMGITGPLLRILSDRLSNEVKIIAIDILSILLSKVGNLLKPFYPQIQLIFFRSLIEGNRSVRLQAAVCISRFSVAHTRLDSFFTELITIVKTCPNDILCMKETGYYALRLSVSLVGSKLSPNIHRQIIDLVSVECNTTNDSCRITAASCLGTLCSSLSPEQLEEVCGTHLLDDTISDEWTIRHYRSIALRIALKDAYEKLLLQNTDWSFRIHNSVVSYINSTKAQLIISGIKCAAYIIFNSIERNILPERTLLTAFSRGMNHNNNDVKQTVASSTIFFSQTKSEIPNQVLRSLVPLLVNGTKEKNTMVRINSEQALVALLKLKETESQIYKKCVKCLDSGAADSLKDCVAKIKKNIAKNDVKEDTFDDTLLL